MTLADLLDDAWGHSRPWVYWATSQGTPEKRTLDLADKHGVIARSLSSNQRGIQPYLYRLRPRDRVLLCYNGEALGWYRLLAAEAPTSAGALPVRGLQQLPPIFKVIPQGSRLGKSLVADGYPAADGLPAGRSKAKLFTALAVEQLGHPPYPEPPEPRKAGDRFAVTPYFKRLLREGP